MYPAGELAVLRQLLFFIFFLEKSKSLEFLSSSLLQDILNTCHAE